MTIDLDALIAESRQAVLRMDYERAYQGGLVDRLADALESTLAELRQERERADEARAKEREAWSVANARLNAYMDAFRALSRAGETIDRIDGEVKNFEQSDNDALCEIERHLTEYGKQKGADRG